MKCLAERNAGVGTVFGEASAHAASEVRNFGVVVRVVVSNRNGAGAELARRDAHRGTELAAVLQQCSKFRLDGAGAVDLLDVVDFVGLEQQELFRPVGRCVQLREEQRVSALATMPSVTSQPAFR